MGEAQTVLKREGAPKAWEAGGVSRLRVCGVLMVFKASVVRGGGGGGEACVGR